MAKRLTGTFYDTRDEHFRIDIYDTDHSGAVTEFRSTSCIISYDSTDNDDLTSPIISSRAKVGMVIPTSSTALNAFVTDYASSDTERFFLEIYNETTATPVWRGILLSEFSGEEDIAPDYIFTVSAMCGLGILKKKPYHSGGISPAIYTGIDRLTEHLTTALGKLPHVSTFWTGTDIFLKTAVDWWAVSMAATALDDPFFQGGVDHAAFYDFKTTEGGVDKDVLSCYDVIWHIMKSFECRIYQTDGVWWVEQISVRNTDTFYARHYDKLGAYLSYETASGVVTLNRTAAGAKLSTINYDFLPPFSQARVKYDVKTRRNYLGGANIDSVLGTVIGFDQNIAATGGTSICRISGKFNYKITNTSAAINYDFIIPKFKLQIGSYYLSRPYDITNFSSYQGACTWSGDSGSRVHIPIGFGNMPNVGDFVSGTFPFDILTPPIIGDGDENRLTFYCDEIRTWQGTLVASGYTVVWGVNDLFLEIYDNGTPAVTEDQIQYTCNGASSSEQYETTVRLGTASLQNSAGRLMRWTGAAWIAATDWGQGVDARDDDLGELLVRNILNARSTIRRKMTGSIFGNLQPIKIIKANSNKRWLFGNISWDVPNNTMQGGWFELEYGNEGINASPVKNKLIHNGHPFPPIVDPNNPTGTTTGGQGLNVNPSPTVLAPVSYNALDTPIETGDTITSIPIKIASDGNEFLAGDSVGLVNPITGQFQYFEIATAPALGATSLSVTSEVALYDFPEDSYLIISQKPYAYTPGNWYTYKGTIATNKVIVSGFTLPANDDACYCVVRRQIYQSPDDFTINYGDNSVNFLSGLGLNGQVAYVKAYA